MKGKYDIKIPFWIKRIGEIKGENNDIKKNKKTKSKLEIEEEKYLETIFSTINGTKK